MKVIKLTENDLVQIIKKVLNEQTPNRKRFIVRGSEKLEQNFSKNSFSYKYEQLKSEGKATEDNDEFLILNRNVQSLVYQENQNGYVKNILVGQQQIELWEKMKKDEMYFSADIIKKVLNNLKGRNRYKYCRLGTRNTFAELETLPKTKPGKNEPLPPEIDTIILPSTIVQHDFFHNNSSDLKPAGIDEFKQTFIEPYKTALSNLRKSYPDAGICIESIYLEASASRFRNQGQAEDMSFEQLSQKRAENVKNLLINGYNELGGTWCSGKSNTTINAKGQNGDGTSGPNPPKPYTFLPKGTEYNYNNFKQTGGMAPKDKEKYEKIRYEFGTPISSDKGGEKAYEQFRYVRPTVKIQVFYGESKPDLDITTPDITPPNKIMDPGQKYWAMLYTWRFGIGDGGGGGSSSGKKQKRSNKHGSVKTSSCSDNTDVDMCVRKTTKDAKQHFEKKKRNQVDYH